MLLSASSLCFFLLLLFFAAATTASSSSNGGPKSSATGGLLELPPLPYAYDALEPFISRRTMEIHHDKHHAKYVNTMNELIQGTSFEIDKSTTLEDIIKKSYENKNQILFNNAAQSWNHAFYWNCMKQNGGGSPPPGSTLAKLIDASFGSFDAFKTEFAAAGNTAFGSGWAWLVVVVYDSSSSSSTNNQQKQQKLQVLKTIGAENPMTTNSEKNVIMTPILTMDVWEHAYYLDYQNMRNTYVDIFLEKLVDWDFVAANLERAMMMTTITEEDGTSGAAVEL